MEIFRVLSICLVISSVFAALATDEQRQAYIVYMGSVPEGQCLPSMHHTGIINQIIDPSFSSKALIRSYHRSFNGFAAYLSPQERQKLTSFDGVLSVFPSQKLQLHTTNSWDFMGLPRRIERRHVVESDIIIGVFDTGIWPEAESFSDEGFGPIPKKWKGECEGGKNFTCNKKIIGARTYCTGKTDMTARDKDGHGTHIASIAAGNKVKRASFYGLGRGIARGGVPSARIAVYKVCQGFSDTDLLKAFDDAIADGVDIISIPMAGNLPYAVAQDPIAIGAFHAIKRNILTITSAGNSGPGWSSIVNYAPWLLVVAASDTDRQFVNKVVLGDGSFVVGTDVNAFPSSEGEMPLVYGKEVTNSCSEGDARKCLQKCIDPSRVHQKVVLCDYGISVGLVAEDGALGCIFPKMETQLQSVVKPIPAASLSTNDMNLVKKYKSSSKKPEAKILKSEPIFNPTAPLMAPFSSRGPCMFMPDILKPDVTAPGVEILAAFSPEGKPSGNSFDTRSTKFSVISGTSMASAHVVGAAAYVKSFNPTWSATAIKSALMTTARKIDPTQSDAEFAYGSGHIDLLSAKEPGLVYEISIDEYFNLWCHMNESFSTSVSSNSTCPKKFEYSDINYPSMTKQVAVNTPFVIRFPRTVTNVGKANSTYVALIKGISKLRVSVKPEILQFTSQNQNMSFVVTVSGIIKTAQTMKSVSLVWKDGIYQVSSPIVVYSGTTTVSGGEASTPSTIFEMFVIFLLVVFLY